MKHIWSILCKNAVVDKETNNVSIFDVVERVTLTPLKKPIEKNKFSRTNIEVELVSLWVFNGTKKEKNLEMLLELRAPNKKIVKVFEKSFPIPEDKKRLRTFIKIRGLNFEKSGDYFFCVKQKENQKYKIVAEVPIEIKFEI